MRTWLNSNWLDLLIAALVSAIEVTMLTPWLIVLVRLSGNEGMSPAAPIGAAIVGFVSWGIARHLLDSEWDVAAARGVSIGAWVVMLVIWYGFVAGSGVLAPVRFLGALFQFDVVVLGLLLLGGLAWWRGLLLASNDEIFMPSFIRSAVMRAVVSTVLAVVATFIVSDSLADEMSSAITALIPILVVSSLVGATAVQVRFARRRVETQSGQAVSGISWLGAGGAIAVGVLTISGLIAAIAGYQFWNVMLWPMRLFFDAIGFVIFWVLTAFAYIVFFLLQPLFWLVSQFATSEAEPLEQEGGQPGLLEGLEETSNAPPDFLILFVQGLTVVTIVAIVIWLALRSLRRFQNKASDEDAVEARESLFSSDALRDDLSSFLNSLRPRWGSRSAGPQIDLDAEPGSVRDAYRNMLVLGYRQQLGRDAPETPNDYAGRLESVDPGITVAMDDLTRRYLRARYGDQSDDDDLSSVRDDWNAIREALRRRRT